MDRRLGILQACRCNKPPQELANSKQVHPGKLQDAANPLHVWLEVRNKLFVIDKYAGKNSQRLAKNNPLLAKCEELGRPELSTPLTWKTWHQFLRYTESRVLC
ncbi:MAG: hypothetical protein MPJ78_19895, partial [Hyphomicrobiaceae bacterium]|nr:hypothetical protein [Hyphomicrobiaceae bacterium]